MTDQPDLDFTGKLFSVCETVSKEQVLESYPQAHARRTDGKTSRDAAVSVTDTEKVRDWIMHLFREFGEMHDEYLVENYTNGSVHQRPRASDSGIRSRRAELVRLGKLRDSGERGLTASGRKSVVWEIVKS